MTETAEAVIANNLPTFSECYRNPTEITIPCGYAECCGSLPTCARPNSGKSAPVAMPSVDRLHAAARRIIEALEAAGFEIKRANSTHGFDPRANPDPISG